MTNKFQISRPGYDSYLNDVVPEEQATLSGALSYSLQQITNIEKIKTKDFAKIAKSVESTILLPDTNGTDVPVDTTLVNQTKSKIALGSGVYGTYTVSNFFGAMTGLPYPLQQIYAKIKELETQNLRNIYQNLYLAVTWEQASATFDGTNFTYTNRGGGYNRGTGSPTVTVGGNPATAIIGTDPNNLSTFGRLIEIQYTGPSGTVVIDPPPGAGWPSMNAVVQSYINDANNEIQSIYNNQRNNSNQLNALYDITGTALKHEQRARYIGLSAVPVPYDDTISSYPSTIYNFVDSVPSYSKQTLPHMYAQTLEQLINMSTAGGQSIIAMMRQERNQERLAELGIALDNNLQDSLNTTMQKQLMVNGTLPNATEGVLSSNGQIYTIPSWPNNTNPYAYYDNGTRLIENTTAGSIEPILNGSINPIVNPKVPIGMGPELMPKMFKSEFGNVPNFQTVDELPPQLDLVYTSTTLMTSTYNVGDAITKVIECNCDCWVK